jgi:hypothetical protein
VLGLELVVAEDVILVKAAERRVERKRLWAEKALDALARR